MAISQTKYVNIVSTVGGAETVAQRELIGRIFTQSLLVPADSVIEFSGGAISALASIADYFGVTSNEYSRAADYFSFVSKKGTQPSKISFAHYSGGDDTGSMLIGDTKLSLDAIKAITDGSLVLTSGETDYTVSSLNFSSVTSFADAATTLSTAVSTATSAAFVVTYMSNEGRFAISAAADDVVDIAVNDTATTEAFGFATNTIYQPGNPTTPSKVETLTDMTAVSNNFLSFMFMGTVTSEEAAQIAEWVAAQNVRYMFCLNATTQSSAESLAESLANYTGVALSFDPEDKVQILPMCAFAAIDYTRPNASINMMYQQHPAMTASVYTDSVSNSLDSKRVNYYGRTQQAGQWIDFYQKGVLMGEISDMGVFTNEAWLKDAISSAILNLRLALDTLPATSVGEGMVKAQISNVIDLALSNGVINPGKTLSSTQKAYIGQISGETDAWLRVQSNGYWLGTTIVREVDQSGAESYKVNYRLIYAKGDAINFVDGTDILI